MATNGFQRTGNAFQGAGFAFQQTTDEIAPAGPVAAGIARARRKRYFVEIDGQQFLVDNEEQARQLLNQARAIAEHQAEQKASRAEKVLRHKPKVPRVEVKAPEIRVSPEIRQDLIPIIEDIQRLYVKAAELAELRLLLMRQQRLDDDDEDELLFLL